MGTNGEGDIKKLRLATYGDGLIMSTNCAVHLVRTTAEYATYRKASGAGERRLDCIPGS
jgi:hypothetical protein